MFRIAKDAFPDVERRNPWILRPGQSAEKHQSKLKLICFHHAGGNASFFWRWRDHIDSDVDLVPVQLPGRCNRIGEPPINDMGQLVAQICASLHGEVNESPFALFGYSLGGMIAHEVAHYFESHSIFPTHTFIAAVGSTHLYKKTDRPFVSELPDSELLKRVSLLGGTPLEVLENKSLLALSLPIIRSDYRLLDQYRSTKTELKQLKTPVTVLGGENDSEVSHEDLEGWRKVTSDRSRLRAYPGGHFFIQRMEKRVVRDVLRDARESLYLLEREGNDQSTR